MAIVIALADGSAGPADLRDLFGDDSGE